MALSLSEFLQNEKRLLFVGVGNVLRSDDGVGIYISKNIKPQQNYSVLTVELSLENYIGKINNYYPSAVILLDSVNFNQSPGYCALLPVEKIKDHLLTTHNISLKNIAGFISSKVMILGIQPFNAGFGEDLSSEVKKSADTVIRIINRNT